MRAKRHKVYNSKAWREVRDYVIKRQHGLCARCKLNPAREVHHIQHLTDINYTDDLVAYNPDNLEALCPACHNEEHFGRGAIREGLRFDEYGNIRETPHILEDSPMG